MKLNEIKKILYKSNPEANFIEIKKGFARYSSTIQTESNPENEVISESKNIFFSVPFEDMGDATFSNKMESKFLIRWIVETEKVEL